ncbi:hypothetical protein VTK73DRAFT_6163 [Phialemonium thermophilum]|uniref:Uncharacterized protein n=1 Tax=Phialemonium thermophilum TaxID=223376 RepID=A0ABR3WKH4_9PEZI
MVVSSNAVKSRAARKPHQGAGSQASGPGILFWASINLSAKWTGSINIFYYQLGPGGLQSGFSIISITGLRLTPTVHYPFLLEACLCTSSRRHWALAPVNTVN